MADNDVAFTSYAFKAAGGSVSRTLPLRLSETVVNVKDWGAVGDGIHDDTNAINDAVDYAFGPVQAAKGGIIIFFPPGTYLVTSQLVLDRSQAFFRPNIGVMITYQGGGREATNIIGSRSTGEQTESQNNGFLVQLGKFNFAATTCMRDLTIHNTSTDANTGALQISVSGINFKLLNCRLIGFCGLSHSYKSFGVHIQDCIVENSKAPTFASEPGATRSPYFISNIGGVTAPVAGDRFLDATLVLTSPEALPWDQVLSHTNISGSCGMYLAQAQVINCHVSGFDVGIALSAQGSTMIGCSFRRCGVGLVFGLADGSPTGSELVVNGVFGVPGEAYGGWGPGLGGATRVSSCYFERCTWGALTANFGNMLCNGFYFTGQTGPTEPAAIASIVKSGSNAVVTTVDNHNLPAGDTKLVIVTSPPAFTQDGSGDQILTCTNTGAKTFTYALSASPSPDSLVSATWNYPIEHDVVFSKMGGHFWAGMVMQSRSSSNNFDMSIDNASTGNSIVCTVRSRNGWGISPVLYVNAGIQFFQCGPSAPLAIVKFADLPSNQVAMQPGPIEGQMYNIIDAQSQPNFGGTVSGGGSSNHYKVRYDGRNWIRVG